MKPATLESEAEEIYQAYPRKVGRPKAIKAIMKVLSNPPRSVPTSTWAKQVLHLTQAYAKARHGEDHSFTPHPSTFFNQHRFEDDPSTWKGRDGNAEEVHAPDPDSRYGF